MMLEVGEAKGLRVAVLASGGGTNFQALIDAKAAGHMPSTTLGLLVASKPDIGAIARATAAGIPHAVLARRNFDSQEAFDDKLLEILEQHGIEALVLAGYLGILSHAVVAKFERRIVNVHPALIPAFCGRGYYGMHVHQAVIESGVKVSGCTVHLVDSGVDTGAILAQATVLVAPEDDPLTLQKKVLSLEHQLLPQAVEALASGRIVWRGNRAFIL